MSQKIPHLILCLICIGFTFVLATPDFPINLVQDGPYVFTDNVVGCNKGIGVSMSLNWTLDANNIVRLCGVGWKVGSNRTIDYEGGYNPVGNTLFSIYGWTRNPLVEYSVVQGSGMYTAVGATLKGTTICNGAEYDVLLGKESYLPAIDGTKPFTQYWSRRRYKYAGNAIKASVDMACHFKAWESFGMKLGTHDFQLVSVEAVYTTVDARVTITSK